MPEQKTVEIELEIEDGLLFELMKMAHEADLTFNEYVRRILEDRLGEIEGQSKSCP